MSDDNKPRSTNPPNVALWTQDAESHSHGNNAAGSFEANESERSPSPTLERKTKQSSGNAGDSVQFLAEFVFDGESNDTISLPAFNSDSDLMCESIQVGVSVACDWERGKHRPRDVCPPRRSANHVEHYAVAASTTRPWRSKTSSRTQDMRIYLDEGVGPMLKLPNSCSSKGHSF